MKNIAYAYDGWKTPITDIVADIINIAVDKYDNAGIETSVASIVIGVEINVVADLVMQL